MIPVFRSRWVRYMVIVAIALLILFFALKVWLASEIGRGLVESRLSASLGRPARLDGEFTIRVFPYPGASGTSMKIFTSDGRWLVLETGSYFAQLSLRPFLRGEVEVMALALENASIDLQKLSAEPQTERSADSSVFQLPAIGRLDLVDAAVYFDGMGSRPYLLISRFSLDDFQLDAPSDFEAEIALVADAGEQMMASSEGRLVLRSAGTVEVVLSRLDVNVADFEIEGVDGKLEADLNRSVLGLELNWDGEGYPLRISASGAWDRLYDDSGVEVQGGYALEGVEVVFGDDRISGRGCLVGSEPLRLNLDLSSESLDLDAIYAMIDSWRQTSASPSRSPTGSGEAGPASPDAKAELPFDLAMTVAVEEAMFQDALARGVLLRVGSEPQCTEVR